QKEKGQQPKKLGELLIELGHITEDDVLEALAGQAGMEMVQINEDEITEATIKAVPPETANTYQIIPLDYVESTRTITIAMKSPDNFRAVDDLRLLMGFKVKAVVAPASQIDKILSKKYSGQSSSMATMIAELGED